MARSYVAAPLPAGAIDLDYDFRMVEGVPTYQFDLAFTSWQPLYEDMTILVKGISGQDVDLRLTRIRYRERPRCAARRGVFPRAEFDRPSLDPRHAL